MPTIQHKSLEKILVSGKRLQYEGGCSRLSLLTLTSKCRVSLDLIYCPFPVQCQSLPGNDDLKSDAVMRDGDECGAVTSSPPLPPGWNLTLSQQRSHWHFLLLILLLFLPNTHTHTLLHIRKYFYRKVWEDDWDKFTRMFISVMS